MKIFFLLILFLCFHNALIASFPLLPTDLITLLKSDAELKKKEAALTYFKKHKVLVDSSSAQEMLRTLGNIKTSEGLVLAPLVFPIIQNSNSLNDKELIRQTFEIIKIRKNDKYRACLICCVRPKNFSQELLDSKKKQLKAALLEKIKELKSEKKNGNDSEFLKKRNVASMDIPAGSLTDWSNLNSFFFHKLYRTLEKFPAIGPYCFLYDPNLLWDLYSKIENKEVDGNENNFLQSLWKAFIDNKDPEVQKKFIILLASQNDIPIKFNLNETIVLKLITMALDNSIDKSYRESIKSYLSNYLSIPPRKEPLAYWWKKNKDSFCFYDHLINTLISKKSEIDHEEVVLDTLMSTDSSLIDFIRKNKKKIRSSVFDKRLHIDNRSNALSMIGALQKHEKQDFPEIYEIIMKEAKQMPEMLPDFSLLLIPYLSDKKVFNFLRTHLLKENISSDFKVAIIYTLGQTKKRKKKAASTILKFLQVALANPAKKDRSFFIGISVLEKLTGTKNGSNLKAWKKTIEELPEDHEN